MIRKTIATLGFAAIALSSHGAIAEDIKIGFLVKMPEEGWFQDEWRFAEQAAKEKGFTIIKIGVPNGEKVMSAIDNLAAQQAQGFVICVPDVKLGTAIAAKAKQLKLKFSTVDDRLIDGKGKPIESVPHMGISAFEIGKQLGAGLVAEMKVRKWNMNEVGALRISFDELPTAKERTDGVLAALKAAGFPTANVISAPQAKTDTESAFNAGSTALLKNQKFKKWLAFGLNDEAALGAVRAAEGQGIKADSMIAIGIGGSASALSEFAKKEATGFVGTVLLSPKRHGYETAMNMYEWVKNGKVPPALTLTSGTVMYRNNQKEIKAEMGL
ncbi:arabinose ABC transporter substrate-binding protein [Herbaspirillum sp. RTI4]|uniref:arabinose ABC transporter substrate-binding protein n=1 Tax=Herbaspirillum sp. RTI4 TaxID=3048640 RepID=UPI002AB4B8C6|nr:arabinose ABC transporter substrate-binding protein [Herbaspirillum sp. RTI4]MDY7578757.1 arabinose ABC transporter substrate-binding protein [Herbaspirillum sp. RTI4]MEA9982323.1 arabinose ABC transporter substrate-binding protein [Herbaspirillum sp. RTI4]